ncbi:uncharacterized protein N7484_009389 [Penicillium longicatenatum]|uniref:uncharacterized protein n=1 Tax=Penicillium longicatenatum TaxID=1561947 RepID=UPI002547FAF8|nr:uncharacterized protein N7484_009389 [Penicillium longicatenatum]KAJ5636076.1 hypothetical protein N7484_009389 [Penicillium longicatenatum]
MQSTAPPAKRRKPNREPIQKATIVRSATDEESKTTTGTVDKKILDRIQKCLDRASHPNTTEAEAKAALFVSQKLMSLHNISQGDLIANDTSNNKGHYGGKSVVSITKIRGPSSKVIMEAFVGKVASAMSILYDCKCYSTDYYSHIDWSFFGIANNTVVAARAFEVAHNKILEWACDYKGGKSTFSYRLGAADGLKAMAYRERKRELTLARRKALDMFEAREREEADERRREVERLQILPNTSPDPDEEGADSDAKPGMPEIAYTFDGDDDENDLLDTEADFNAKDVDVTDLHDDDDVDAYIDKFVKQEPAESPSPDEIPPSRTEPGREIKPESKLPSILEQTPWESDTQLVQFRATSEQVANDYLTENHIKLRNSKRKCSTASDVDAYRRGQQDSSKIEVGREALE